MGIRRAGYFRSWPSLLVSLVCTRSLLALLLSAPQEVARRPAHRVRHPAHGVCDRAHRTRRGRLEGEDLVLFHARHRAAGGLRRPTANAGHLLLGGPQDLLALPEGHAHQLAASPIAEGDEPLEPFHLPELGQGLLLDVAGGVVHPVRGALDRGHPCVHAAPPFPRRNAGGPSLPTTSMMPPDAVVCNLYINTRNPRGAPLVHLAQRRSEGTDVLRTPGDHGIAGAPPT